MNKDQVTGELKKVAGKVQQGFGKVIGSPEQQAKGIGKQVTGDAQKALGDVEQGVKNVFKKP